ncbi:hypothetical protein HDU98_003401, partial [Podochytrium sp. JEL0797]
MQVASLEFHSYPASPELAILLDSEASLLAAHPPTISQMKARKCTRIRLFVPSTTGSHHVASRLFVRDEFCVVEVPA